MPDYTGIYRGAVHNINDPESRGRIQALVPAALGKAVSAWAEPVLPTATDPVWSVGDRVWILFEDGDVNRPAYISRMEVRSGDIVDGAITVDKIDPDANLGTDGDAPATATTLSFIGGIGSVFFRWTEVPNQDPVTYHLHVVAGPTGGAAPTVPTDGTAEVASGVGLTFASVRALKDGTAVVGDGTITYYGVVTIEDADGPGPTSSVASGVPAQVTTPDIYVNAITSDMLISNNILASAIDATDMNAVTVTGATLQTEAGSQRGIKIGLVESAIGLFAYTPAGDVFLKAVPAEGMAMVAGEVKARTFTVSSSDPAQPPGSAMGGTTKISTGGRILLTAGTTAPASAPTVTSGYDIQQFTDDGRWGSRRGWTFDGTYWYTTLLTGTRGDLHLEKWDPSTGTKTYTASPFSGVDTVGGCVVVGSNLYVLYHTTTNATWSLTRFPTAGTAPFYVGFYVISSWTDNVGQRTPALGYDASANHLLIVQSRNTDDKVQVIRYNMTGAFQGSWTSTWTLNGAMSTVLYGLFDYSSARYVFGNSGSGDLHSSNSVTGAEVPAETWPSGVVGKVGVAALYTGTTFNNFVSMDQTGKMRTYTGAWSPATADMTKWVSNTLAQGSTPTYETDESPRGSITLPKRSKLIVTTSAIPSGADADRVRIYVGSGSSTNPRYLQTPVPAAGVITQQYTTLTASGGTPPPANSFPNGAGTSVDGSVVVSGITTEQQFIKNDGSIPASNFRNAIDGRITTLVKAGQIPSGTMVAGTTKAVPVTFAVPFPPGVTPRVSLTVNIANPQDFFASLEVGSTSRTGFTIRAMRPSGTLSQDIDWTAIPNTG